MVYSNDFLQGNLGRFWYFDVSKGPGEKKAYFRVVPKWCVFQSDLVRVPLIKSDLVRVPLIKLLTHSLTDIIISRASCDAKNTDTEIQQMSLRPSRKNSPKMAQNYCESPQWSFWAIFGLFLGPGGPKKSQILSALIRTGFWQPKLRRCITWLTPFVKKS